MADVSIIIPAANEEYLQRTIDSVFASARGDIEVIAITDGYDPALYGDNRLKIIHNPTAIGQRQAVNQGARYAKGKYILKLDAHCAVAKGFDAVLMKDCERDWTVIPRLYQLDEKTWIPKWRKRTDFMFIRAPYAKEYPFRIEYYDAKCARAFREEYRAYKQAEWRKGKISDTMASLGAGWFMHRERFIELGMLDENHGSWGQMGVEIALKSWLSGGRHVVNKKTWYAHLWRRHAPWHLTQRQVDRAREHSIDLWMNGKWSKQKKSIHWLVDKFAPVPTWNKAEKEREKMSDLTLLFYTANRVEPRMMDVAMDNLKAYGYPIISVSQKPMDLGHNICVGDIGQSAENIYKQVCIGLEHVKTPYVALVEDDCLYIPEHFEHRSECFAYNTNRWLLHADSEPHTFSYRERCILCQLIAPTELLRKWFDERNKITVPENAIGEPGVADHRAGIKPAFRYGSFKTSSPNVVLCHRANTSGRRYHGKDAPEQTELAPWGDAETLLRSLGFLSSDQLRYKKPRPRMGGCYKYSVKKLYDHRLGISEARHRRDKFSRTFYYDAFSDLIDSLITGRDYTDEEILKTNYYEYLESKLNPADRNPTTRKGKRHAIKKFRDAIKLFKDIRDNGIKSPLTFYLDKRSNLKLYRGGRRLPILYKLGIETVPLRIFRNFDDVKRYEPESKVIQWHAQGKPMRSIHELAMNQFSELGWLATDKYWIQGYIPIYDNLFRNIRGNKLKLLEFGVRYGASLLLWHDAFPKAQIYGVDKDNKSWKKFARKLDRVKVFIGNQTDEEFLKREVIPNAPFDVIIDDCGHEPANQMKCFETMYPHLAARGYYVIEDCWHSYHGDPGKETNTPRIMAGLIDHIYTDLNILSLQFYYNLCVIQKGL